MRSERPNRALLKVPADDRLAVAALIRAVRSAARVPVYMLCGPDHAVGPAADALVAAIKAERTSLAEFVGRHPDLGWRSAQDLFPESIGRLAAMPGPPIVLDDVEAVARSSKGWSVGSLRAVVRRSVARPVVLVLRATNCEPLGTELESDGRRRLFVVGSRTGGTT